MTLSNRQVAEAFSTHRFDLIAAQLADDVRWDLVGQEPAAGKAAVLAVCERTATELTGVTTTFDSLTLIEGDGRVVVDSVARYVDGDGAESVVSSCDIYHFAEDTLTAVKSYAIELAG